MTPSTTTPTTTADKLNAVRSQLSAHFLEREEVVDALMLGLLSRSHVFLLGEPGTGKSALIRALVSHLEGARYFEALLSRTRPAEAILGPWDLPRLRDHGDFVRRVNGYLPTADIAFLDEIGKMGPTLGHDLLAMLNERRLHQVNGTGSWHDVPLSSAFAGSNELPGTDSDDASALWDRLLLRVRVERIGEASNMVRLLGLGEYTPAVTLPWTDVLKAIDEATQVEIPASVIEQIIGLRADLAHENIHPSDRRWRESMRIIRASAWLNGNPVAEVGDARPLMHVLWDDTEQIDTVHGLCLKLTDPISDKINEVKRFIAEVNKGLDEREGHAQDERGQYALEIIPKINERRAEVEKLRSSNPGKQYERILDLLNGLKADVLNRCMSIKKN